MEFTMPYRKCPLFDWKDGQKYHRITELVNMSKTMIIWIQSPNQSLVGT